MVGFIYYYIGTCKIEFKRYMQEARERSFYHFLVFGFHIKKYESAAAGPKEFAAEGAVFQGQFVNAVYVVVADSVGELPL